MKLFGRKKEEKRAQFEEILMRLVAAHDGSLDGGITPQNCKRSPTVHAIDTAISRRFAVTPVHVYQKTMVDGMESKRKLPNHPVAQLLAQPNDFQTAVDFWSDAASTLLRWGNFYAWKSMTGSGRIARLIPLNPKDVEPVIDEDYVFSYKVKEGAQVNEYGPEKLLHARTAARNFVEGDSPIKDIQTAIGLEILAEQFGESFFKNGALPTMVFRYMSGTAAFRTAEEEKKFIEDFQAAFGGAKRFRAMLLPKGIEEGTPIPVENDKAQFLETRKYQRTVIAGALGVPPHFVGDLERATFNNVEQQDQDFTLNVIMPLARVFEAACERDLLTSADRDDNIVVRFNLDSTLRADFRSRQEGLKIQREMGVVNPNEWREIEGMNPREDGDDYWSQGPSGQGAEDAQT